MSEKKPATLAPTRGAQDPFALLRQVTSEFDRVFDDPFWPRSDRRRSEPPRCLRR